MAGALQSLLGPEYAHGHLGAAGCALHVSTMEDQIFHKDTQRAIIMGHRTFAVMVSRARPRLVSAYGAGVQQLSI